MLAGSLTEGDSVTRRMSRAASGAHTRHHYFCSCDKVVSGNGARYQHRQMHLRAKDGHHFMVYEDWRAADPGRQP
jgi:hypothetical protein